MLRSFVQICMVNISIQRKESNRRMKMGDISGNNVANLDFHALTPNKIAVVNSTIYATNATGLTPKGTPVLGRGFGPPSIKVRTKRCIWKTYATFVVFTGLHVVTPVTCNNPCNN